MTTQRNFFEGHYRSDRDVVVISNVLAPNRQRYQDLWLATGTPNRYDIGHVGRPVHRPYEGKLLHRVTSEDFDKCLEKYTPLIQPLLTDSTTHGRSAHVYEDLSLGKVGRLTYQILGMVEYYPRITFHHVLFQSKLFYRGFPDTNGSTRLVHTTCITTKVPLVNIGPAMLADEVRVLSNHKSHTLTAIVDGLFLQYDNVMYRALTRQNRH